MQSKVANPENKNSHFISIIDLMCFFFRKPIIIIKRSKSFNNNDITATIIGFP